MTFETACIHGSTGTPFSEPTGAVSVPIYQSATFAHPELGKSTGFDYSRAGNPTRLVLEKRIACLEGAGDSGGALAYTSGMAAFTAMLGLFKTGDHILAIDDLYGGSIRMFGYAAEHYGIAVSYYAAGTPLQSLEQLITPATKALYLETPTNPLMYISDIQKTADFAHAHNLLLIVDNTFLTPYFQKPLQLGADIVLHSGTKYLNGHNDTLAGFLVTADAALFEQLQYITMSTGAVLSPFDSFLVLRGLQTLPLRMEKIQQNAHQIVRWLEKQPRVQKILYPGYPESEGIGGMISFTVDSPETVRHVLKQLKLIKFAESLGGGETLITYPTTQTHNSIPEEERIRRGITDTLLRLSCGLESAQDLQEDLAQALA